MKKIILLFLVLLSVDNSYSQTRKIGFCQFSVKNGFYRGEAKPYITEVSSPGDTYGLASAVQEILQTLSIKVPVTTYVARAEDNCYATINRKGTRVIIADIDFLEQVNSRCKTEWAAISILAHEVGHHISNFSPNRTEPEGELDADYWSGYTLQKLGASRDASVKAMMYFGSEYDSNSHPNKYSRSKMIKQGWDDASNGRIDYSKCDDCH